MTSSGDQFTTLEFHDARLASIEISCSGAVMIHFRHMSAYLPIDKDTIQVWSCSVCLELSSSEFAIQGSIAKNDYVTEGALNNPIGNEIDLASLLQRASGPGRLDLLLAGSGTRIRATFASARIESCQRNKLLETITE